MTRQARRAIIAAAPATLPAPRFHLADSSLKGIRKTFNVVGQDRPAAAPAPAPEPEPAPAPAQEEPPSRPAAPTLVELTVMTSAELRAQYHSADAPKSLTALDGDWNGHVLAGHGALSAGPADALLRWLGTRPPIFPWNGKTFHATGDREGHGHNRIQAAGERTVARFDTRLAASLMDGRGCVLLDYDLPTNPFVIRPMRDELRRLTDDLYLGPAMWRFRGDSRPMAFFALTR